MYPGGKQREQEQPAAIMGGIATENPDRIYVSGGREYDGDEPEWRKQRRTRTQLACPEEETTTETKPRQANSRMPRLCAAKSAVFRESRMETRGSDPGEDWGRCQRVPAESESTE